MTHKAIGSKNTTMLAMTVGVIGVALLSLALSGVFSTPHDTYLHNQRSQAQQDASEIESARTATVPQFPPRSADKEDLSTLPASLQGTDLRFRLAVDEDGNLRVSADLKDIFDYFLSAIVDEDISVLITRIDRYLASQLEGPALAQAKAVLDSYIGMKEALYHYEMERSEHLELGAGQEAPGLDLLESQLRDRNEIRQRFLSKEVYDSFYAQEEAYDEYTLQRLRIEQGDGLNEDERLEQLAVLEANAPEFVKESRADSEKIESLRSQTQAIVENGGDLDSIHTLRAEMYGDEAAERFKALDQERNQWQARVEEYLVKKQALLDMEGLSEADKTALVDQLRAQMFSDREQIRVRVLERKA